MIGSDTKIYLSKIILEDPGISLPVNWYAFLEHAESEVNILELKFSSIGELYTSMSFPLHYPGFVKDVDTKNVWIGKDINKANEIRNSIVMTKSNEIRPLVLAQFDKNKLFIVDGQHRARAIYEGVISKTLNADDVFPAVVLINEMITEWIEDLKQYR